MGIRAAVALISMFAPDLVSGSEQQHLSVAAFATRLWGMVAAGGYGWPWARCGAVRRDGPSGSV